MPLLPPSACSRRPDTPAVLAENDPHQVNLGVKFVASASGTITGIKYYKSAGDTGTHTGSLWTSTGTLLATATFSGETNSGWQTVTFSSPISITAGTSYVASYHSNGNYADTSGYFAADHVNGVLTAPASTNGVYIYGAGNLFPNSTFGSTNYWVDVVFSPASGVNHAPLAANDAFNATQNTALTLTAAQLLANDTDQDGDSLTVTGIVTNSGVNGTASLNTQTNIVTFTPTAGYAGPASFQYTIADGHGGAATATVNLTVNAAVNHAPVAGTDSYPTVQDTTLTLTAAQLLSNDTDSDGDPITITGIVGAGVNGTATYSSQTNTVTFIPTAGYTGAASFQYAISDGRGGTANGTVNLTVNAQATGVSLFASSNTPAVLAENDPHQVNLGVRFVASGGGTITGIKYYKSAGDTGTHIGSLWSSTGTLLASATFSGETTSGWQTVTFSSPVSITAGTTYVASFHSNGNYADTSGYFATDHVNGPLTAAGSNNGVYIYGAGNLFPTNTFGSTNYWVDVLYNPTSGVEHSPVALGDSFNATQNTPLTLTATQLLANDTDQDGDALTVTGVVSNSSVNGTASFNAQNNTVTFTPTTGYTGPASFQYAISDGRGGTSTATVGLTVNTQSSAPLSLFSASSTPSFTSVGDPNSVELGMKFQSSTDGFITGISFYKGTQNTGTHVADLWSSTGTPLASATFTNETATGWQQVNFATPVAITAGTTYIASYHTSGNYAADPGLFANAQTNGPLTGLSSASSGGNGVYAYGSGSLFPTNTYNSTSYGVDVLFRAQLAA